MESNKPQPPDTFENPKGDNPWDNDAVQWLLTHEDVASHFDRHNLFECARRQPRRLETDLDNVILAAQLCERYGVRQVQVFDSKIGKTVWRLVRTDSDAPPYPEYDETGDRPEELEVEISAEDRAAADRLMKLMGSYEQQLRAAGRAPTTVFTYVDRAERFLRWVRRGAPQGAE